MYLKNFTDFYYKEVQYIKPRLLSPTHGGWGGTMRENSLNATHTTPIMEHRGHLWHFLKLFEKTIKVN